MTTCSCESQFLIRFWCVCVSGVNSTQRFIGGSQLEFIIEDFHLNTLRVAKVAPHLDL